MRFAAIIMASFLLTSPLLAADAICFSPAGNCGNKLVTFINSSQKTLDIAIYSLTHQGIVDAISAAYRRGVKIRIVVDYGQAQGANSQVYTLDEAGVPIRIGNQRGIMHNKFTIVDGKKIETGSFNYSKSADGVNAENQIYLSDPDVVASYSKEFKRLWDTGTSTEGN